MALDDPLAAPPAAPQRLGPVPSPVAVGAPRWMRWLLVASLALNLLILGLVAGDATRDGPGGRHLRPADIALGPVASALAQADKAAILRDLQGRNGLDAFGPRAMQASLAEVGAALRADPFDAVALAATIDVQMAKKTQAEAAVREAVVARIASMTPADRAAFADRLEDGVRRGGGRD